VAVDVALNPIKHLARGNHALSGMAKTLQGGQGFDVKWSTAPLTGRLLRNLHGCCEMTTGVLWRDALLF